MSRVAGHAKRLLRGRLWVQSQICRRPEAARNQSTAPRTEGAKQIAQRGGEGEQVPPRAWNASLTNWSTPQEPLSSTRTCSASGSSWTQTARESSKRSFRFRQPEKTALSAKLRAKAKSQAAGEEQETKNTERPRSSITGGTRQIVPAGHPRPIWSRFLPGRPSKSDPCHTTKRRSQTLSCSSSRLSKPSLHITHPLLLGRRGLGSARETAISMGPKRTVTLCPNQDWS